jgi:hypothetical protein
LMGGVMIDTRQVLPVPPHFIKHTLRILEIVPP